MRSYITILAERRGGVATAVRGAEDGPDTDTPAGRRDDISLHDAATTTTVTRDVEGGEDVAMKVMLPRLIDTCLHLQPGFLDSHRGRSRITKTFIH
ncbi:uncharacterized protein BDCG_16991 [Blastomyces dermatitidis ER-3]|uniref:Uncharacterized protein n=1 Tax=Ajellomyces dermatitidis (strain ER-3 / ATCC MYA-2586) TaxID=559297 RepID=A0ABX2VVQ5_AJEDR|nr:uncharacterized protein BDCG_16991 [Blastomyces dermatitidis ER-3]OAT01238.1 hypothetical protein BDCG_16991 [Blastomyces dermatitidis ER-3]